MGQLGLDFKESPLWPLDAEQPAGDREQDKGAGGAAASFHAAQMGFGPGASVDGFMRLWRQNQWVLLRRPPNRSSEWGGAGDIAPGAWRGVI